MHVDPPRQYGNAYCIQSIKTDQFVDVLKTTEQERHTIHRTRVYSRVVHERKRVRETNLLNIQLLHVYTTIIVV